MTQSLVNAWQKTEDTGCLQSVSSSQEKPAEEETNCQETAWELWHLLELSSL